MSVKKPTILIHTPVNTVEEYQEEGHAKVFYNSKTQETSWSDEKSNKIVLSSMALTILVVARIANQL